jgi:glycosyltransferase involved in cell wall biosynthesis
MACGRPIVVPDESAIRHRISAGNGFGVPIGDVEALHQALENLISNPIRREDMGAIGRHVAESLDWRLIALRFQEAYLG